MSGSVVPPGYEPNPNYYIGSNRQPFVRACPPGSIRTPTGQCKKIAPSTSDSDLQRRLRQLNSRAAPACGPGQYIDPDTGRCRDIIAPPEDASLGYMSDDAAYMVFGSKTLGMGGTHRRPADFGKSAMFAKMASKMASRGAKAMKLKAQKEARAMKLKAEDEARAMLAFGRNANFGRSGRRCGFGTCAACKGR